jgi:nucleotide-binding universal stress UspA family protein
MMFNKILVAWDHSPESDKALDTGIELAKLYGVDLYSITVTEDLPSYVSMSYPDIPFDPEMLKNLDDRREQFYVELSKEAAAKAAQAGVTLHATVVHGFESEAIVAHAREIEADLLLLGLHPHPAVIDHLWGSTEQKIAWAAPCSILAVR